MSWQIPDIDLDCNKEAMEELRNSIKHINASKITVGGVIDHGIGIYPMNIPTDPITGLSAIDYKRAEEEYGFIKIDILHNLSYEKYKNRTELLNTLKKPVKWDLLTNQEVVSNLPHLSGYYNLLQELKVNSIPELAMFLAIIRPGKKYLQEQVKKNGWDSIKDYIWIKEEKDEYQFKKSHGIAYAMMISLLLR